ncbi:TIGR03758 family integrating conjugative element protein [Klebsiella aerogenes]|uniref:TIGR03758 family integrating conjugative element protein n=1 Tax=Klebsiella aerogenes TaxID=548 RepID=UPI001D0BD45B|nr:TIGR03758 family integrating conjugative element protein [Klebsiella aerogenes]
MTPEQISAFQAASLVKPDTVSLVIFGLFSAFLLLWVVWVLNDAYRMMFSYMDPYMTYMAQQIRVQQSPARVMTVIDSLKK